MHKYVGQEIGVSDWVEVSQDRINQFAEATGDHQWIHVDPARAADGPFGTTIAHGFLTLSLTPMLVGQAYRVDGIKMAINYGVNKVRFTAPLPVGSNVRAKVELTDLTEVDGGVQSTTKVAFEVEGSERPACVAETVTRYYV
jgi:acyl dehydratase